VLDRRHPVAQGAPEPRGLGAELVGELRAVRGGVIIAAEPGASA